MKKILAIIIPLIFLLPIPSQAVKQVSGEMPVVQPLQPAPVGSYINYQGNAQAAVDPVPSDELAHTNNTAPTDSQTNQPTGSQIKKPIDLTKGSTMSGNIFLGLLVVVAGFALLYFAFRGKKKQ